MSEYKLVTFDVCPSRRLAARKVDIASDVIVRSVAGERFTQEISCRT